MALLPLRPSPTLSKTMGYKSTSQRNSLGIPWWMLSSLLSLCVLSTDVPIFHGVVVVTNLFFCWVFGRRWTNPLLGAKEHAGVNDIRRATHPRISEEVINIIEWKLRYCWYWYPLSLEWKVTVLRRPTESYFYVCMWNNATVLSEQPLFGVWCGSSKVDRSDDFLIPIDVVFEHDWSLFHGTAERAAGPTEKIKLP